MVQRRALVRLVSSSTPAEYLFCTPPIASVFRPSSLPQSSRSIFHPSSPCKKKRRAPLFIQSLAGKRQAQGYRTISIAQPSKEYDTICMARPGPPQPHVRATALAPSKERKPLPPPPRKENFARVGPPPASNRPRWLRSWRGRPAEASILQWARHAVVSRQQQQRRHEEKM